MQRPGDGVRRIVTWDDGAMARARIRNVPASRTLPGGTTVFHLWAAGPAPGYAAEDDGAGLLSGSAPPAGGARAGVLDIAPGAQAGPLHRTDTVDYAACLFGEIDLVLPGRSVRLKAGDVVVQCGATHSWANPGPAPARLMFVMTDAGAPRDGALAASTGVEGE